MSAPGTTGRGGARQIAALVVLASVLVGVIWWQFFRTTGSSPAASNRVGPREDAAVAARPLPTPQVVRLATLDAVEAFGESTRNPFAYGARTVPTPPPSSRMPGIPAPLMPTPAMAVLPQGPPPIGLRLTGITIAADSGRTLVTLKDPASNALFQAFEGDIVDGRYRVVKVGQQSVVLSYVDGSGTRTISLGG